MRVLVLLSSNPGDGFLVNLHTEELVREIKRYLAKRNNSKAMVTALTKGKIEREVGHGEAQDVKAELVLTKKRACWDLTKG
jgi:hypothetical protein